MTKGELERQKWNDIFLEDCAVYDKKIAEEYTTLEEQIAKLKEENKELKEVHESDKRSLALIAEKGADLEKENIKLKEEIKKWKDEWQEQVQKANDEGYARTLQTIQLNKAKKIIGNLYAICKDNHYPNTSVLIEQAEQFLKENK